MFEGEASSKIKRMSGTKTVKAAASRRAKQIIGALIPGSYYRFAGDALYALADLFIPPPDNVVVPPLRLQHDGPRGYQAFRRNGEEAFLLYREVLGIRPDSAILDIGSGVGRKTIPLMAYLNERALYVGIDISQTDVDWCSRNITTRSPRIVFVKLDVKNPIYNPRGRLRPDSLVLPFPDESFDFVLLWSVFTHMYPNEMDHYLGEVARVLRPNGVAATSNFIMNANSFREVAAGRTDGPGVYEVGGLGCWTRNPKVPHAWIGVPEEWIRNAHHSRNLTVQNPIHFGAWSNNVVDPRYRFINYQDIVISQKT